MTHTPWYPVDALAHAATTPNGITFVSGQDSETVLSYAELRLLAYRMLHQLHRNGVRSGTELVFQIEDPRTFLIMFWACQLGAIIAVPVAMGNGEYHRDKLRRIMLRLESPSLIADTDRAAQDVACLDARALLAMAEADTGDRYAEAENGAHGIALLQFSSGSTGDPKGVIVTSEAIGVNVADMIERLHVRASDVYLSWMPLTHDFGIMGMHMVPLYAGIPQVIMPTPLFVRRPTIWLAKAAEHRATMLASPNFGYRHFLSMYDPVRAAGWDLQHVRTIQNGAEPVSLPLCHEFMDALSHHGLARETMLHCYGLAEATLGVSSAPVYGVPGNTIHVERTSLAPGAAVALVDAGDPGAFAMATVGRPVTHCQVEIRDVQGHTLPEGVVGSVCLRGRNVSPGYYGSPEATADVIDGDGWLNTRDLGFMHGGQLFLTGRAKDIIFVGGLNVYPHDVERIAEEVDGIDVNKAIVAAIRRPDSEQDEIALFLYAKSVDARLANVAMAVADHVMQRMALRFDHIVPVANIPKTSSGKVQRYRLGESFLNGAYTTGTAELRAHMAERTAEQSQRQRTEWQREGRQAILRTVRAELEAVTGVQVPSDDIAFAQLGITSVRAIAIRSRLASVFGVDLPVSTVFDHPTLYDLVNMLHSRVSGTEEVLPVNTTPHTIHNGTVAITGMACHFPGGASTLDTFWECILHGKPVATTMPEWRGIDTPYRAAVVDDVDRFDHAFFRMMPTEAEALDPQQRLLLETVWHAIEDAGIRPSSLGGTSTGIYVGVSSSEYAGAWIGDAAATGPYSLTGTMPSTAAGRIAYMLNTKGPVLSVDTACSSSLAAVHLAVQSLHSGETSLCIVCGVNVIAAVDGFAALSELNALSPDGTCKTFDEAADGYGRGEGCGVVILQRTDDADAPAIRAIIAGTAMNHDGRSNGLTAPNGIAQRDVIRQAMANAAVTANDIDYIETHGTGTPLGDPQEVEAIAAALHGRTRPDAVPLGAVKAVIGHLESAAGIAGLMKAVLVLQHRTVPALHHVHTPTSRIPWASLPVQLPLAGMPLSHENSSHAGVSSFGLSGTNVHVILRSATAVPAHGVQAADHAPHLLTLSATTPEALQTMAGQWADHIDKHLVGKHLGEHGAAAAGGTPIAALCRASQERTERYPVRMAVWGNEAKAIAGALRAYPALGAGGLRNTVQGKPVLAWMFTGQGAQYPGMLRELYAISPTVRAVLDEADEQLKILLGGISALDIMHGEKADTNLVRETILAQPLTIAAELALARFWQAAGVMPNLVMGHSVGEFAAACVAGMYSVADTMKLVFARAAIMQRLQHRGAMAAIVATEADVQLVLDEVRASGNGPISIAAINATRSLTVSGTEDAVAYAVSAAKKRGWPAKQLVVSHAFHSPLMEPTLEEFEVIASIIQPSEATIPFVSCRTGQVFSGQDIPDAAYWTQHIVDPVRFTDGIVTARGLGATVFQEIGPTPTLAGFVAQSEHAVDAAVIEGMRPDRSNIVSVRQISAELFVQGIDVATTDIESGVEQPFVRTPLYPFGGRRFWKHAQRREGAGGAVHGNGVHTDDIHKSNGIPAADAHRTPVNDAVEPPSAPDLQRRILESILLVMQERTGLDTANLDVHTNVFSMGVDSLVLMQVRQRLQRQWNVEIPVQALYKEAATIQGMADLILERTKDQAPAVVAAPAVAHTGVAPATPAAQPQKPFVAYRQVNAAVSVEMSEALQAYTDMIVYEFATRIPATKRHVDTNRTVFANGRTVLGFRPAWKELIVPIQVAGARGAEITDIDGNTYIDLTMGFGVCLFGHDQGFIRDAVAQEVQRGIPVGPVDPRAATVAQLVHELTGVDRVAFFNTGTEAVMVAVRLARTTTMRDTLVMFAGSYHGTFDGIMTRAGMRDGLPSAMPLAPGTTHGTVRDVVVLEYGTAESLAWIRENAHTIAAVLVEPVQSRRPDLQPKEFLQSLRNICTNAGAALIFDEVITGFRISPGGAQEWFDIRADLVTYGKVVGGGLPVGIVAGTEEFMDAIDGGAWAFGDDSTPQKLNTFTGGTFCHHPLAMAAAEAVLTRLKNEGVTLLGELNARTERLVVRLQHIFTSRNLPVKVVRYGSLFRFVMPEEWEVFYYRLITKGIYLWEGSRNCFLSTAHTAEQIDTIVDIVAGIADELADVFGIRPAEPRHAPMTHAQQRMFILAQDTRSDAAYHLASAYSFSAPLDATGIESAFRTVIAHHDGLRTGFTFDGEAFGQTVYPEAPFAMSEDRCSAQALHATLAQCIQPYELSAPPLLRAGILHVDDGSTVLWMDVHHIAADGISVNTIMHDVLACAGGSSLMAYEGSPAEAVEREQAYLESEESYRDTEYWRTALAGIDADAGVPSTHVRGAVRTFRGGAVRATCDAAPVHEAARAAGVSVTTFLLGAWWLACTRLAGTGAMSVGVTMAGRPDGFDACVGDFLNVLPLPIVADASVPVHSFLADVQTTLIDTFSRQYLPLDVLVQRLGLERDGARNPLFNITFGYERADVRAIAIDGNTGTLLPINRHAAQVDLGLDVIETTGTLNITLEYALDLYVEQDAASLLTSFRNVVDEFCATPAVRLASVGLLDAWSEQVASAIATSTEHPDITETVVQHILRNCRTHPERTALQWEGGSLTYADLERQAHAYAHGVRHAGAHPGDTVAIVLGRSMEHVAAMLGVMLAGCAYMPLEPTMPVARMQAMIAGADARVLIAREMPELSGTVAMVRPKDMVTDGATRMEDASRLHGTAYVLFTSGSTGTPKGTAVPHGALTNYMLWFTEVVRGHNVPLNMGLFAALTFDVTQSTILAPLMSAGTLYIHGDEVDVAAALRHEFRPESASNVMNITPTHVTILADIGLARCCDATVVLIGEPLLPHHVATLRKLHKDMRIINAYGPTETTIASTYAVVTSEQDASCIGIPVPNTAVYVMDATGHLLPAGCVGELVIAGLGVAMGYVHDPERTAQAFADDPFHGGWRMYRTGDMGRRRADGMLEFHGRRDGQVKLRGQRVEIGEVESLVATVAGVKDAVVVHRKDSVRDELVLVISADRPVSTERIRTVLRKHIPSAWMPADILTLSTLPRTASGKINRKALAVMVAETDTADTADSDATAYESDELLDTILGVWAGVLGTSGIGPSDELFQHGGDSVSVLRIVARLRAVNVSCRPADVLAAPTPAALASLLRHRVSDVHMGNGAGQPVHHAPASPAQVGVLLDTARHGGQAGIMHVTLELEGDFAAARMQRALDALVARHDALQAAVTLDTDGRFVLERRTPAAVVLEERDAPSSSPFDLLNPPALRASYRHSGNGVHLTLSFHHAFIDGWSLPILIEDLLSLYADATRTEAGPSFMAWCAGPRAEASVAAAHHWHTMIGDATDWTSIAAPAEAQASVVPTSRRVVDLPVSAATVRALDAATASVATTRNTVMHLAWAMCLAVLTGERSPLFAFVASGRTLDPELEHMIGQFVTTLPWRIGIGEATVRAALRDTHERLMQHIERMCASTADALRGTPVQNKPLGSVLVFENYPLDGAVLHTAAQAAGLQLKAAHSTAHETAALVVTIEDMHGLVIRFDADAAAYSESLLHDTGALLERTIVALAEGADVPCSTILETLTTERSAQRRQQSANMLASFLNPLGPVS